MWGEPDRKLRDPIPTTPVSEDEDGSFRLSPLILRTCRNCTEVLKHPFHKILASVQYILTEVVVSIVPTARVGTSGLIVES